MASGKELSYWACVFSVDELLRGPERRSLFDSELAPKSCYLWTWTFADPVPRYDAKDAAKRWTGLAESLRKDGRKFVRSIEQGEQGAWHYHGITGDRWDAKDMWERAERHGFGRVDVVEIPLIRRHYVAKYIRKRLKLPRGMRRWACVGFEGVPSGRLKSSQKILQVCKDTGPDALYGGVVWTVSGYNWSTSLTYRESPFDLPFKQMELKPSAIKHIVNRLQNGAKIAVGEYRGTVVRKVSVDDWKTKQTAEKIVAEHTVEIGGAAVKVGQWLPAGSKESDVKAPANKGDLVIIEIESDSRKYGIGAVSITPLANLV